MTTVLVTGASGFIGKNLCVQLELEPDVEILRIDKDASEKDLKAAIEKADFIFHLAGINRPQNESEFDKGNRSVTEHLISLLSNAGKKTPILITSSIQANLDNAYGKSKKAAEDLVFGWAKESGASVFVYRLPNVFGKWCRPNYNSVVATFCHNIANNLDITISDPQAGIELVYVDDVVTDFIQAMRGSKKPAADGFCHIPRQFATTVQELANKLRAFRASRDNLLMPSLEVDFDKFLYATYISYLDTADFGYKLDTKTDERGWLAEFFKSKQAGQIYASCTKPGFVRGNHWHHTKIEKFLVLKGEAEVKFRKLNSDQIVTYKITGDELKVIDVPAGYVHSIKNTGSTDMLLLIWSDEIFDPKHPDTYFLEV